MHLSADWAGEIVAWLASHKIKTQPLLDQLHIDAHTLKFGQQISVQCFAAILNYGASQSNDPHFGLYRGSEFRVKNGGVLGYLAASAETVGDAILRYQRYASIVCDGFALLIEYDRDCIELHLQVSDPAWRSCPHLGEFTAARTIGALRTITGMELHPLHVHFMHPRPGRTADCRRFFHCNIDYDAPRDIIRLSREAFGVGIPSADSRLGLMLQSYADELLHQVRTKRGESLEEMVTRVIRQRLSSGRVSLRDVAARLGLSERTLRRRLSEVQVTFGGLVEKARMDLANHWITGTDFDLKHISFLLGYSEPAAFSRAYKRWTGRTPRTARVG